MSFLREGKFVLMIVLVLALSGSVAAETKYSFGYKTNAGEVLYYKGEVKTDVQVSWQESEETGDRTIYYSSSLTTQNSRESHPVRLEETEVVLPNGEVVKDEVTYQILAPDFVYVEEMGSAVTAGLDFFPPVPVAPGSTWTIKSEILVPMINDTIPVTTTYELVDVVSLPGDEVAIISQELHQKNYEITYLKTKVDVSFDAKGFMLWSLESGDYVGRYVISTISMEVPEMLGSGTMITTIGRSEVIDNGTSLTAPPEDYIRLYVDYLTKE